MFNAQRSQPGSADTGVADILLGMRVRVRRVPAVQRVSTHRDKREERGNVKLRATFHAAPLAEMDFKEKLTDLVSPAAGVCMTFHCHCTADKCVCQKSCQDISPEQRRRA